MGSRVVRMSAWAMRNFLRRSSMVKIICLVSILSVLLLTIRPESTKAVFHFVQGRQLVNVFTPKLLKGRSKKGKHFQINEVKGEKLTYYNMTFLAQRAFERKTSIEKQCQGHEKELLGLSSEKWAYERIEINRNLQTTYCPLLKVGSTFWRRVFHALRNNLTINTPYDVGINQALGSSRETLKELLPLTSNSTQEYFKSSLNIMFVREPFSRLISGYVDKLFAPNPYFWNVIGKFIIRNYRKNPSPQSLKCGHDVTFPEFVKYVIDTEENNKPQRDAHFTPTYDQCKPCQIPYNAIGKMENFKEDTAYIFHSLGYEVSKASLAKWAARAEEDAVWDSTMSPFSWRKVIKKCMPFHQAAKRIWHKMQIRGIVRKDINMPLRESETGRISAKSFIRVLMDSRGNDRNYLKEQKHEVLRKAYAKVPSEDIDKIRKLFKPDFELFGYDTHPKHIFPDTSPNVPGDDWVFNVK